VRVSAEKDARMSMMARFVAISPDQLSAIKDSPEMVEGLFAQTAGLPLDNPLDLVERLRRHAPQLVADTLAQLPPELRQQLQQQLGLGEDGLPKSGAPNPVLSQMAQRAAGRRSAPPAPGTPGHSVSIDKAWHGLHCLLCGAPEPASGPLGQAVFGGTEVGEDQGYGPARYFTVAQVAEIAGALRSPNLEHELRARFDAAAMTQLGIYPGVWETEDLDWLIEAFRTMRDFYAAASQAEQAVVTLLE
jgi:hypothetical protein